MKIVSWNVNGIRSLKDSVKDTLKLLDADILCFQEVKASRSNIEEENAIIPGFNSYFSFPKYSSGYSGVVIYCNDKCRPIAAEEGLSRQLQNDVPDGIPSSKLDLSDLTAEDIISLESEGRAILTNHKIIFDGVEKDLIIINVYCPRVDCEKPERAIYQMNFYKLLQKRAEDLVENKCHVLILGDINTSHCPIDNCDPGDVEKFGERPSRQWLSQFLKSENNSSVFVDTFRHFYPNEKEAYTCWSTLTGSRKTNFGTRIDYILANFELLPYIKDSFILANVEGSDHCPIGILLMNCEPVPSSKCPSLCAKYWPEFAGKQTTISKFLKEKSSFLKNNEIQSLKRSSDGLPKQKTITGFFSPKISKAASKLEMDKNVPKNEDEGVKKISCSNTNLGISQQASVWKSLLKGPTKPPKCKGHEEDCLLRTVKKQGSNFGKQFYCCSKPPGAPGNPEARCDYFLWKPKS